MSKFSLFGILFLWLVFATYIVNSLVAYDATTDILVNNPVSNVSESGSTNFISQFIDLMGTYWAMLTFSIDGMPAIFSLFFQVPTAIIGFMITQLVVDAI